MRLAKRGEKFLRNVIFNDKFALVSIRKPEVKKVTIIGPGMPFVTLNEKNEVSGLKITCGQLLEEDDWPTLRGWVVAFYETKNGKRESIKSQAKQLAEILESEEFSEIDTIELIGVGKIGLLFLITSQYVERRLHIATIGLKLCMPYLEYTYCDKESLEELNPFVRNKYKEKLLRNVNFENIAIKHNWIDFEEEDLIETCTITCTMLWLVKIINRKLKSNGGSKIQDIIDKNFFVETQYSDILTEVYHYFQR